MSQNKFSKNIMFPLCHNRKLDVFGGIGSSRCFWVGPEHSRIFHKIVIAGLNIGANRAGAEQGLAGKRPTVDNFRYGPFSRSPKGQATAKDSAWGTSVQIEPGPGKGSGPGPHWGLGRRRSETTEFSFRPRFVVPKKSPNGQRSPPTPVVPEDY